MQGSGPPVRRIPGAVACVQGSEPAPGRPGGARATPEQLAIGLRAGGMGVKYQPLKGQKVLVTGDDSDYIHGQTIFVDGGMTLYPEFARGG